VFGSVIFGPVVCVRARTHTTGPKNYATKHRLRTQNITSNFSQARSTIPEDGS